MGTDSDSTDWDGVAVSAAAGDLDSAARLLLGSALIPGMQRQLQAKFPRMPAAYVEDAVAEAVAETFQRLGNGAAINLAKVGGYIYNTARYLLTSATAELKQHRQFFDAETTPYDAELVGRVYGLSDVADGSQARADAISFLASLIDVLPSSDSAKQVLRVRFEGAAIGDWLTDGEVAELLGKEKTSISSWWRRGLADLRQHCADRGINRTSIEGLVTEFDTLEGIEDDDVFEERDEEPWQ